MTAGHPVTFNILKGKFHPQHLFISSISELFLAVNIFLCASCLLFLVNALIIVARFHIPPLSRIHLQIYSIFLATKFSASLDQL